MKDLWGGRFRQGLDPRMRRFSSSLSRAVSMMTFRIAPPSRQARATARISSSTTSSSPAFRAPTLMTMSTSVAPLAEGML